MRNFEYVYTRRKSAPLIRLATPEEDWGPACVNNPKKPVFILEPTSDDINIITLRSEDEKQRGHDVRRRKLTKLKKFSLDSISDLNKIDFHLIDNFLKNSIWQITTQKAYEWNPSMYNVGEPFAYILNENYAPLNKRVKNIYSKLKNVPAYYEAAMSNIKNPSNEHLQLAIQQNKL